MVDRPDDLTEMTLAFQGNVHELSDEDAALIEAALRDARERVTA